MRNRQSYALLMISLQFATLDISSAHAELVKRYDAKLYDELDPWRYWSGEGVVLSTVGPNPDHFENLERADRYVNTPARKFILPVGRLEIKYSDPVTGRMYADWCTAWLVAPNLAISNFHCLPGRSEERRVIAARIRLNYHDRGNKGDVLEFEQVLESNSALDYSLIKTKDSVLFSNPPVLASTVSLADVPSPNDLTYNEPLVSIQHPLSYPKRLLRTDCYIFERPKTIDLLHHCRTWPGSSGSPLFSERSGNIVAIHHREGNGSDYNEAILLSEIIAASPILKEISRREHEVEEVIREITFNDWSIEPADELIERSGGRLTEDSLRLSAFSGNIPAAYLLGAFYIQEYIDTSSVAKLEVGTAWLRYAFEKGNQRAESALGIALIYRGQVDEGAKILKTAAERGLAVSQLSYARFCSQQKTPHHQKSLQECVAWAERAGEQGMARAMLTAAEWREDSRYGAVDLAKAAGWYERAVRAGLGKYAALPLGKLYFDKKPPDYDKAHQWLSSPDAGDGGKAMLAWLYHTGNGVTRDDQRAVQLLEEGMAWILYDDPFAVYMLGRFQAEGVGSISRNPRAARRSMEKASRLGSREAAAWLASH